jgi:hypothetical protein
MSTKTNFKRVALVAVASLGLGVLTSVAPASAVTPLALTDEFLALATSTSSTADTGASLESELASNGFKSFGLITTTGGTAVAATSTIVSHKTLTAGAVATGVVYSTAVLNFAIDTASKASIVVTGGTIAKVTGGTTTVVSGSSTSVYSGGTDIVAATVRPGVAAGSTFSVAAYTGANVSASTPTNGVLAGIWTFTVATSSGSAVYASTYSNVSQQAGVAKGIAAAGINTYDTSSRLNNGQVGIIYVALADAYGAAITTGTLAISATSGATVVGTVSGSAGQSYGATTSFSTLTHSAPVYVYVNQPVANTAGSTTVTITHDGQVVGTKTITWGGDIASLTVDTANSAGTFANNVNASTLASNTASIGNVIYVAKDAAGNVVNVTGQPTVTSQTGALVGASVYSGDTLASGGKYQTAATGYGYTTMFVPESILNGAASYQLQITNTAGVTIKSAVVNAKVSNGGTHTFTVKWDKTAYVSGDIATMSIASVDAYGNTIAEGTYLTGLSLAVNSGGFQDLSLCSATSSFSTGGVVKCKYAVLNTAGSYAYSVELSSGSLQVAVIGTAPITTGPAGVTNADVLKAIVSLIASINKQIAALQKALLKK